MKEFKSTLSVKDLKIPKKYNLVRSATNWRHVGDSPSYHVDQPSTMNSSGPPSVVKAPSPSCKKLKIVNTILHLK